MSPGESVLPRNVRACQVGPPLFWRPYKRRIGQQINTNSSQYVHLHSFALQCLRFFMKFGVFKKQHLLSRSTKRKKQKCISVCVNHSVRQPCLHPSCCFQILTSKETYIFLYYVLSPTGCHFLLHGHKIDTSVKQSESSKCFLCVKTNSCESAMTRRTQ